MELFWSIDGLLTANSGHTWRYSDFDCELTPSMYHYVAAYIKRHINPACFSNGTYFSDGIEARAVYAYYGLSSKERIGLHEQELVNLAASIEYFSKKRDAIVEAILAFKYETPAFFPISNDVLPTLLDFEKKYEHDYNRVLMEQYQEQNHFIDLGKVGI